jgi:hypothetical protein
VLAAFFAGVSIVYAQPKAVAEARYGAVRHAVLSATKYDPALVEVTGMDVQLVVTIINSNLNAASRADRKLEAIAIASSISSAISHDPALKGMQALHVDYIRLEMATKHRERVDGIDFRKDPQGQFKLHMT